MRTFNQLDVDIMYFAGSREYSPLFLKHYNNNLSTIEQVYRGMPFPKHLLKVGNVIEEWHGSTHWSIDKDVAIGFTTDYINEEYEAEIYEELGLDFDSDEEVFVKVVLCMKDAIGYPLYKDLERLEDNLSKEKEITIIGENHVIMDINKVEDIYYVDVVSASTIKTTYNISA